MKNFFKRSLPPVSQLKSHPNLQFFGDLLHDPNLWHFNRRSLAGGSAVGLFIAFIPMPMQMLLAAAIAILLRVNLPVSVSLVWITNPITMPPLFYFAYMLGTVLLGMPTEQVEFSFSQEWLLYTLGNFWQPLLLGSFILGFFSALSGYLLINFLWRSQVTQLWQNRREKRLKKLIVTKTKK
ncbi:DUF2062 domain-containing protein [Candidatus Parabeggiatoa sp. HSG14]|uniref:DUF2062 domain-containing protein n=1 Tax=Candidatus Parabeggiatoa sp. HSG14 TaxID=3055593 RepID=UPI0025A6E321|nr:DUF2062 domain-containing protein [Thiotrichales bacterium HSG14]